MAQVVIRTQPINLAGLRGLKVLPLETRELPDILGELRRTSNVKKDEQILDTLDELAKETMEILKEKGISLMVGDLQVWVHH